MRALLATGLLVACLAGPGCGVGDGFRVMSYNIQHGRGMDGVIDLERIARVIVEEQADVVALQEVDRFVERSGGRDLLRELSELTGLEHFSFGKNIDFQGGDYGNAVLSRHPITHVENTHLRQRSDGERRGVLQIRIDRRGREIAVLNTHLDHRGNEERAYSIDQIQHEILPRYAAYPVVFAGDFNETPGGDVHARMTALLDDAWEQSGDGPGYTFPSDVPDRRIDYVFHSRELVPRRARVPQTPASDHLPVVVAFR